MFDEFNWFKKLDRKGNRIFFALRRQEAEGAEGLEEKSNPSNLSNLIKLIKPTLNQSTVLAPVCDRC